MNPVIHKPILSIPETAVLIPEIYVENRRLILGNPSGDSAKELGLNWRLRRHPICKAVRKLDEDASWSKELVEADLVKFEEKHIWLSLQPPSQSALACPDLIQLKDHFGEVAECLKLWRTNLGTSADSVTRLKRWLESKLNAAPWVAHLAETILSDCSPWPDPYKLRPDNDTSRDWSPEQCIKQVLPLFRVLEKAPLRGIPPNFVAIFLSLIRTMAKKPDFVEAHAWPGDFSEMWNFKIRTRDHSWINGEIVGESHAALGSSSPLKFKE